MKTRAWVLIAALLVVGGAVAWLAFGLLRERDSTGPVDVAAHPGVNAPAGAHGTELTAESERALEPTAAAVERSRPKANPTIFADPSLDPELRAGSWVEGRVELAPGTPADEDAWVVAKGRSFESRPLHRAKVSPDGHFRVAFAQGTQVGWLQISARYNFLADDLALRPAKPPKDIVLKGSLGGCVRGKISLPPPALAFLEDVKKGEVSIGEHEFDFFTIGRKLGSVADDLSYEVGGIDPAGGLNLLLKARGLMALHHPDVTVEAGRATIIDLAPELGIRLSGRVVNAAGDAVAEARVSPKRATERTVQFFGMPEFSLTKPDGSFELVGLEDGAVSILTQKQGYEPFVLDLGQLARGTEKKGLEIKLGLGLAISGRVEFPGGKPAVRARVAAVGENEKDEMPAILRAFDANALLEREPVDTAPDGTFRVTGLAPGTYTITAEAWVDSGSETGTAVEDEPDRARKVRRKGTPWSGRAERVAAGAGELVVSLKNGETIRGRVVDSDGKPIERFVVNASPETNSPGYTSEIKGIERAFRDKDGRFALDGLRACGWSVSVRAKGHLDGEAVKITVPGANHDLRFKLLRQARLAGVVLDTERKPLARAKVVCAADSAQWWSGGASTHTNEKGEFTLTQVPLGAVRVHAEANGFARGEPLRFELGPGATRTGLELSVAKAGAIKGLVKKGDGDPDAGRSVNASEIDGHWDKRVKTDDQGEFKIEGLGPGRYKLVTQETHTTKVKLGEDAGTIDVPTEEELASAVVAVRAGETVSVTLGAPARSLSIRMHGRVKVEGGRATKISVTALASDAGHKSVDAPVGEDGSYEVHLVRGGAHRVEIERDLAGFTAKSIVQVPATADFEKDFEFPSGSVSGRVVTSDDAPVKAFRVRASAHGARDTIDASSRHETATDENGAFTISCLEEGVYTVETVGAEQWWDEGEVKGHARIEGVKVVAAEPVRDLVLALKKAGDVTGTVRSAAGEALPFVEVFAFDEHGHSLQNERGWNSNSAGRFTIDGAPAGRVFLYARTVHSAGKASAIAHEDEPSEVDIVLRPRADLTVLVQGAGGASTYAPLEIVDEEGRHFEEIPPLERFLEAPAGARSFPSLPAGKYAIRAWGLGSEPAEKGALLSEGGRADVVLH
jgi:hypothetical protein